MLCYHEPRGRDLTIGGIVDYRGKVSGGVVVLEPGADLPEGAEVRVEVLTPQSAPRETTLGRRLMKFAGRAQGLPADMAENHDHYLHGQPKR